MWCLANIEQTRNIRVIILARIRPEEGNKLGEPGRRQNFFFSSSVADVALKARSLHENKQERHLYKDK